MATDKFILLPSVAPGRQDAWNSTYAYYAALRAIDLSLGTNNDEIEELTDPGVDLSNYAHLRPIQLDAVTALRNLTEIDLSTRVINNPYLLANLDNLEILKMQNCVILDNDTQKISRYIDFTFLESLTNLRVLELKGCYWKSSHSPLSNLKKLNTLSVNLLCKKPTDGKTYNENDLKSGNDIDSLEDNDINKNIHPKYLVKKEAEQFPKGLIEGADTQQRNEQVNLTDSQSKNAFSKWLRYNRLYQNENGNENKNEYEEVNLGTTDFLLELPELKDLTLQNCQAIVVFDGIERLKKLEKLILISCSSIFNLESFSGLESLQKLTLIGSKNLKSLVGLEEMKAIKKLVIETYADIEDISTLRNITNIRRIAIPAGLRRKLSAKDIRFYSKINKLSEQLSTAFEVEFD